MGLLWTLLTSALAGTTPYPGAGEFGALLFEDNWPCAGDADYNDAVIRYHVEVVDNGAEPVTVTVRLDVHAVGASIHNGLGLRIPGLDVADVYAARLITGTPAVPTVWGAPVAVPLPPSGDVAALLAADLHALCASTDFVNTDEALPGGACAPLALELVLHAGTTLPGGMPWDVHLQRTDDPTHQIHLPQYDVPSPFSGTCDDASDASGHYLLTSPTPRIPAAIDIPEGFDGVGAPLDVWPRERVRIDQAMPQIVGWFAGTGGQADFYLHGDDAYLFGGGSGRTDPIPTLPAGVVPPLVFSGCDATLSQDLPSGFRALDLGGAVAPFTTYCDNTTAGGGWTLVAKRQQTGGQSTSANLTDLTTMGRVLPDATWGVLRDESELLVVGAAGPVFRFSIPSMKAAYCTPLATSLLPDVLAHHEDHYEEATNGRCGGSGSDYSLVGFATRPAAAFTCNRNGWAFRLQTYPAAHCEPAGAAHECCWVTPETTQLLYVR